MLLFLPVVELSVVVRFVEVPVVFVCPSLVPQFLDCVLLALLPLLLSPVLRLAEPPSDLLREFARLVFSPSETLVP